MRVVYVCADLGIPLDGTKGAAVHVRSVVRAFAAQGHELLVVAAAGHHASLDVPVVPIRGSAMAGEIVGAPDARVARALAHLWNNPATEAAVQDAVARFNPDLVYERYAPFGAAGSLVARRAGLPHVLEVNAPLAWEGERYRRQALADAARTLERAAFAATSRIVAVSAELKALLVAEGVPGDKIAVVPNGVDVELFQPAGDAWNPDPGRTVVGFVGSLKPWHGIELMVESFRSAATARPDLHLLVVGDGPDAHRVDALAAELPGRVTRVGGVPHEEVPRYLRGMAVALAPYMPLESFYFSPLKILEYMAAGRPVVASGIGQVSVLLRHERSALLVLPGDPAALTEAVLRLAGDAGLRRRLGAAARREAVNHDWRSRAADLLAVARAAA